MGHAAQLAPMVPELVKTMMTTTAAADDGVGWCNEHHRGSRTHFGSLRERRRSGEGLAVAVAHGRGRGEVRRHYKHASPKLADASALVGQVELRDVVGGA